MKQKLAALLALSLALSGCQSVPASAPEASLSSSGASASEAASSGTSSPDSWQFDQPSTAANQPKPTDAPAPTVKEVKLPDTIYTSTAGHSVSLLTPAQYDVYYELGRGGPRNFLTADFFWLGDGNKFALSNANGKIVTDFDYDLSDVGWSNQVTNMVYVVKDGKYGVIDTGTGKEVIPAKYDFAFPLRGGKLIECQTGDKIELLDLEGKVRFTLTRGDDYTATPDVLIVFQNEMLKLYSMKDFSPIKNFGAEEMNVIRYEGKASEIRIAYTMNGKVGLCDGNGKILVEPTFQEIGYYEAIDPLKYDNEYEYAIITQDNKKGVIDARGNVVVKPAWTDIILGGKSAAVCWGGLWGAIPDLDSGVVAIEPLYDFMRPFVGDYATFQRGDNFGLVDKSGNEMLNTKYDLYQSSTDIGLDKGYLLFDGHEGPGSYGIITTGGDVILSGNHYFAMDLPLQDRGPDKFIATFTPQERWGYIDSKGQFVIDARFENAGSFLAKVNLAFVQLDGKICMIDRKGNVVLETVFSDLVGYNPETMVGAFTYTNEKGETKGCLAKIELKA